MEIKNKRVLEKNFILVVIGQVVSLFGNAILRFALPLYLLKETDSAAIFGMVTAVSFIPMVILSMIGGILADRVNKRNMMVILDLATAGLISALYLAFEKLPLIPLIMVVLMALYGISGAYQPVVQASVPLLVSKDRLIFANAVINLVSTLSNLLGPIVGGILFGTGGLLPILILSILCFFLSAIMETFIRIPFEFGGKRKGIFDAVKEDLQESVRFVRRERPIFFSVAFLVALFNVALTAEMIVGIPILIIQILQMSDYQFGITQGVFAFGGLFGGVLAAIMAKKLKIKNAHWLLGICAGSVGMMGVILMRAFSDVQKYTLVTILCFVAMASATLFSIQIFAMLQEKTPSHLIGKIMASMIAVALCAQPLGQAIYGVLFDRFQQRAGMIFLGSAVVGLLIALYAQKIFTALSGERYC